MNNRDGEARCSEGGEHCECFDSIGEGICCGCGDRNELLQEQEAIEILKSLLEMGYTKEQVVADLQELEARINERAD